ncbi:NAD kinase 2, mitochondrial [Clonorchis sinensis]|uniref:NAD kinase 2, mitochondrial n=1 Tax=Clonorchis sinensis TaxID=79923 RepID=A0A8T1MAD7_CLOSI|nr:NAD kinase 2, mitochondrial [Clonorchis sinensis]
MFISTLNFKPKNVLLLGKLTKYELERSFEQHTDEKNIHDALLRKGVDADWLLARHKIHNEKLSEFQQILRLKGLNVRVADRNSYTTEAIAWADVIFTAGGDGTFLMGASKIMDRRKLLVGLNTDPDFSVGYLCLPKSCTRNLSETLDLILSGNFDCIWRNRLRVRLVHHTNQQLRSTLLDKRKWVVQEWTPEKLDCPPEYILPSVIEREYPLVPHYARTTMVRTSLPLLALNEVFVGESMSARVSKYELAVDGVNLLRRKSSGMIVITGTGSTSWYLQSTALSPHTVAEVLKVAKTVCVERDGERAEYRRHHGSTQSLSVINRLVEQTNPQNDHLENSVVREITERYNARLPFDPEDKRMAYVIFEPMSDGTDMEPSRGHATNLQVRSLMLDAHLVFDGAHTFSFPYGSVAEFSIDPSDALCCIRLRNHN